jgi:hypothetical protein
VDQPNLLSLILIVVVLVLAPRFAVRTMGLTGDLLAQLFVPPGRALGWPHGVQESDEPWAWRSPQSAQRAVAARPESAGARTDHAMLDVGPAAVDGLSRVDVVDLPRDRRAPAGLVVGLQPVRVSRRRPTP